MPFPYDFPIDFDDQGGGITPAAIGGDAKPNVKKILNVWCKQLDAVDQALADTVNLRALPFATGVILDQLGAIVGIARQSFTDAEYRLYIAGQIRANHSSGRTEDLNAVFAAVLPPGDTVAITNYAIASFEAYVTGPLTVVQANAIAGLMRESRAAGVNGQLNYALDIEANLFGFDGPPNLGWDQGELRGSLV